MGLKKRFSKRKPSFIHPSTFGFSPDSSLPQRIISELMSTATNKNRLIIARIMRRIPCHDVNKNVKSPLVTATLPVLLISSIDSAENPNIHRYNASPEMSWKSRIAGNA